MESISETESLYSQIIFRCSKCSLIPFIEIDNSSFDDLTLCSFDDSNKEPKVILKCENNHENKILISKLNEECHKINLNGVICDICKQGNEGIYYCIKCFNFYCNEHKNTHLINEGHYLISKNKLDFHCAQHNRNYSSFCHNDNKNICDFCEDNNHNIEKYKKIEDNYLNDFKNKIKNSEDNLKRIAKEINDVIEGVKKFEEDIIKHFKRYKEINEIEIKFLKDLLNIYESNMEEGKINYQIIQNIKNIQFNDIKIGFDEYKIRLLKDSFIRALNKKDNYIIKESK